MENNKLIPVNVFCKHYEVEATFISSLHEVGLLDLTVVEKTPHLHEDQLSDLERMINLNRELGVNIEGIELIVNLLEKVDRLQLELNRTRNRLRIFE